MRYVFDIEANGFTRDVTEIHCIVLYDLDTNEVMSYHDYFTLPSYGRLSEGLELASKADLLIGHNIATYDIDVMERIGKVKFTDTLFIDTMLLSCILHPQQLKGNSIEGWAKKLGHEESKVQNTDWSKLTSNMLRRCVSDVKINVSIYKHLLKEAQELQRKHSDVLTLGNALNTEIEVGRIHAKQVLHGVGYDVLKARQLVIDWDKRMEELKTSIHDMSPMRCVNPFSVEVKKPFLKSGAYSKAVLDWFEGRIPNVQGPFTRINFENINLNSGQQVKEALLSIGWVPTEWNFKDDAMGNRVNTSPKLTEDSYDSLPPGLGKMIAEYNVLKHRRGLLLNIKKGDPSGSLPLAEERLDLKTGIGNVAADAFTCGTPTARYTHIKPVANLPGAGPKVMYGRPSREIYMPPTGAIQVGVDLAGIEARRLADLCFPYPGGPEFAELVLHGDFHSENARIWGVSRNTAKIILYAMMYGAGDGKLGKEAGSDGAKIRKAFMDNNPAYAMLVEDLETAWQSNGKWIPSIDGRPLYPRTKKDILNTKIQGDSAVIFKLWMIRCSKLEEVNLGLAHQMIAYHDELQFAYYGMTDEHNPECFGERVCREAVLTGKDLGLNVALAAEYKVGWNYAMCH